MPQIEIVGDDQKTAQVTAARTLLPSTQFAPAGQTGDFLKRAAKGHTFEEVAKVAQDAMQPKNLRRLQRASGAAWTQRKGMRPFAGEQAHRLHEARTRRQHFIRGRSDGRAKALDGCSVPRPARVVGARKIRHEEKIKVRQMIGQILGGQGEIGRQPAIGRRDDSRRIAQRQRGGRRLRHRANATDARHQRQGIRRHLALQNLFKAAIQGGIDVSGGNTPGFNIERDFKITLDPVEGAHHASCRHLRPRLTEGERLR